MDLEVTDDLKQYIHEVNDMSDGFKIINPDYFHYQIVFKFPNDYGASVLKGTFTYGGRLGLYELGTICFYDNCYRLYKGDSGDDDHIFGVYGYLSDNEVEEYLYKIKALEAYVR